LKAASLTVACRSRRCKADAIASLYRIPLEFDPSNGVTARLSLPEAQWVVSPGHVMVLFPDPKALDAYPADPKAGGPWVMWRGTPYAHLMVPVSTSKTATMAMK